jgi:hypothetical protein
LERINIADVQRAAEFVESASAFIEQSGICQIARRQPIAVVAFYLCDQRGMRLMPSLQTSFRTRQRAIAAARVNEASLLPPSRRGA